jgi:hypothetical protein
MPGSGLFRDVDTRAVGSHQIPAGDHEVTFPTGQSRGGCEAFLEVIRLDPIVGIDHRDGEIALGSGQNASDPTGRVAIVAMRPVEPQMPHAGRIDPILRKSVRDQQMVGAYGLPPHAVDAPLQERSIFLVVRRYDNRSGSIHQDEDNNCAAQCETGLKSGLDIK